MRRIVPNLTPRIQIKIASRGYPHYCAKDIQYVGTCFGTHYKIKANTNFQIEVNATQRKIPGHEIILAIRELMPKNATCIDIGANVGTYSIAMVAFGARRVMSFEPGPYFSRLSENLRINNLESQITSFNYGIAKTNGSYSWFEDLRNPGNAHLIRDGQTLDLSNVATNLTGKAFQIDTKPLDEVTELHDLERIDLIKIDVELMEWEVLQSAVYLLTKHRPIVVVETSRDGEEVLGEDQNNHIFSFFENLGYFAYSYKKGIFNIASVNNYDKDTLFLPHPL